jgi:hydroxymethylbilane synthase
MSVIKLGSRASKLALWQTRIVAERLNELGYETKIVTFSTKGDENLNQGLKELGSKGLFTAELEEAMFQGEIHCAVHSLKDLSTDLQEPLALAAVLNREKSWDALVVPANSSIRSIDTIPVNALVGTSSTRRASFLSRRSPEIKISQCRGNVFTRVDKLLNGDYDVLCMAWSGLHRMKLDESPDVSVHPVPVKEFPSAAGQGAIAIEAVRGSEFWNVLRGLECAESRYCVDCEREVLHTIGGGCSVPLGVHVAMSSEDKVCYYCEYHKPDGQVLQGSGTLPALKPEKVAAEIYNSLRELQ